MLRKINTGFAGLIIWPIAFCTIATTGSGVVLQNNLCQIVVDPASLEVTINERGKAGIQASVAQKNLGPVANLTASSTNAAWSYPEKKTSVSLVLDGPCFSAHIQAESPGEFTFPVIPGTAPARAWILPMFEGSYAPCGDAQWASFLTNCGPMSTTSDFTMPFVGLDCGTFTLTYIFTNPFNNELQFESTGNGALQARLTHQFTRNHAVKEYGVAIQISEGSPVAPAALYRKWLQDRGEFVAFKEKIRRTPEAAKLPGAAHIYLWGDGVSTNMIRRFAAAGLDRLWLGADSWDEFVKHPEIVTGAKQAGFLIAPYDSFNSIHRPAEANTWETAQFGSEQLYQTGAVIMANGSKKRGFKKKGFILSPDAARPFVEQRVTGLMNRFAANSWFIDCDGFGEYFDDYSPLHPATQESDMQARISRMQWIRDTFGAVIGTEGCFAGVASTVHFAHGVMTPVIGWGDPDLTNHLSKYFLGGWYPPDAPRVFFKPVPVKEEYRYIYFEPRFRLPLFETVFHDSVIATHHWSEGSFKSKGLEKSVELLELLYNIPPLYHLNLEEFQKRQNQIQRHYAFFSPLHRQLAEFPMTDFRWLAPDHSVQQTTFGDRIDLVANFSSANFAFGAVTVPPQSILAQWRNGPKPLLYTP